MGNALLIYMMVMQDARQRSMVNMAISMGKQHTDCRTQVDSPVYYLLSLTEIDTKSPDLCQVF